MPVPGGCVLASARTAAAAAAAGGRAGLPQLDGLEEVGGGGAAGMPVVEVLDDGLSGEELLSEDDDVSESSEPPIEDYIISLYDKVWPAEGARRLGPWLMRPRR